MSSDPAKDIIIVASISTQRVGTQHPFATVHLVSQESAILSAEQASDILNTLISVMNLGGVAIYSIMNEEELKKQYQGNVESGLIEPESTKVH